MTTCYRSHGKRLLDLALCVPALVVLAPVLGVVALAVRLRMGRPVLFRQVRPGLYGRPFTLRKFRTMTDERDEHGVLLPSDRRLTHLGRFLRATSLDELPELFNILQGDMGLVGPRPLLMEYLPLYSSEQGRRHNVRPGLTGWAQVNGRNALTWEEKFQLDVWYVENLSFLLDLRILFRTVATVLRHEGIGHGEHVTMPRFTGSGYPGDKDDPGRRLQVSG